MPKKLPSNMPYIKTVRSKGKIYEYFDTGVNARGKRVLRPLPKRSDVRFGGTYAALLAARTARLNAKPALTMNELIREYQLSKKFTNRASGTQDTYLIYLRLLEKHLGMAPVDKVERRDIVKLLATMQDRPSAANMVLGLLRSLFALAMHNEYISTNPVRDIPQHETDDEDYEPWPDTLLAEGLADPDYSFPIALLYYTGQRIGDVCKMRWDDIGEDGTIYVQQQKTGKELWIPIHAELKRWLDETPRAFETMLYGPKGKPRRPATLRQQLKKWAADPARKQDIVPHGLRKNAVNALLEAGCTIAETASISGQSLRIVEHYAKRLNNRRIARGAMSKWDGTDRDNRKSVENS